MRDDEDAWLAIDLGAVFTIDRVRLTWEDASAVDYALQFSDDGEIWTTARTILGADSGGVVVHSDLRARGRYVRIAMTRFNGTRNYSLFDVNVFGA